VKVSTNKVEFLLTNTQSSQADKKIKTANKIVFVRKERILDNRNKIRISLKPKNTRKKANFAILE
jgi:hypothetical protein